MKQIFLDFSPDLNQQVCEEELVVFVISIIIIPSHTEQRDLKHSRQGLAWVRLIQVWFKKVWARIQSETHSLINNGSINNSFPRTRHWGNLERCFGWPLSPAHSRVKGFAHLWVWPLLPGPPSQMVLERWPCYAPATEERALTSSGK